MPNVTLKWDAPITRASGKPLKPGDISGYTIEASVDGGAFSRLPDAVPGTTSAVVPVSEPGDWRFRVSCFDTKNRTGAPAEGAVVIDDDSPPGIVLNLQLAVEVALPTKEG